MMARKANWRVKFRSFAPSTPARTAWVITGALPVSPKKTANSCVGSNKWNGEIDAGLQGQDLQGPKPSRPNLSSKGRLLSGPAGYFAIAHLEAAGFLEAAI